MSGGKQVVKRLIFMAAGLPKDIQHIISNIVKSISDIDNDHLDAINFNAIKYISQNGPPTPSDGELYLWKDADAGAGTPTHYIVYNDGGTVRTFRSVEVV